MTLRPPPVFLTATEAFRTVIDAALLPFSFPLLASTPSGDGHPVMVLPGFMGTSASTSVVRKFLTSKGYVVHEWGLGRNIGPASIGITGEKLAARMVEIYDGRKISLVGWSLGGVMARELAKIQPMMIRQVITLGSPFNDGHNASHVWELYKLVAGQNSIDSTVLESLKEPPPVPSTSIFSKTDGIVHWKSCLEKDSETTENIEIDVAHCAMGFNAKVFDVIAKKLSMPDGAWRKLYR
jgi:pimeloyl-ACP methyl ester carboxylesterase